MEGDVAEVGVGVIEIAIGAKSRKNVWRSVVKRPKIGGKKILRAENAQVVGLCDGAGNVLAAAIVIFGDGKFHPGILCGDA